MRNALRAEASRLLSRRITLVALLVLFGMVALFQLEVNSAISPPSATELAQNRADYQEYQRDWEANHEKWEADCLDSGEGETPEDCAAAPPDPADWGLAPESFLDVVPTAVSFAVYLSGLVLFVTTASFIGAEATTGALANWLTFIPDRRIVLVSKLVVASVFSLLAGAAAAGLTVAASSVLALVHRQPLTGLDQVVALAGRGVVVVMIFGIVGFCVGLLTGSTGASIGVLLATLFLTYLRMILSLTVRWAEHLAPWSPEVNLAAILNGGTSYEIGTGPTADSGSSAEQSLSLAHGMGYWALLLVAVIAVTWLVFRRRDVH